MTAKRLLLWLLILTLLCAPLLAQAASSTLEYGSRGTEVRELQLALLALGYDPKGTDGKFGRGTENAVKAFQKANGLKADGKAGTLTLAKLKSLQSSGSGSTSTASSGSTQSTTLKQGDSGSRVTELQNALKRLGYYTGTVDGRFGSGTQKAVIAFQKANKLTADGLAGSRTLALLEQKSSAAASSSANTSSSASSSSSSSASFTRTLRRGVTGADVTAVQKRLSELGYLIAKVDGVYGSATILAVKAFQKANGITADGLTGSQTWSKLMSSSASASTSSSSSSSSSSVSSSSSSTASSSSSTSTSTTKLQSGDKGDDVKKLQKRLAELNYTVSADGTYGPNTVAAVKAFQQVNGLTADGIAGAATQELLYSANAKKNTSSGTASSSGASAMGTVSGPSGSSVKLLHWFNEVKPSLSTGSTLVVFDPATNLQWSLRVLSRGNHCDAEPKTAADTATMNKAFGTTTKWVAKPVYVKLPSGTWSLASTHNVAHDSSSIKDNDFNGHLCVHFLRDMDECRKNDPNWGVTNQETIRKAWKSLTGITVD